MNGWLNSKSPHTHTFQCFFFIYHLSSFMPFSLHSIISTNTLHAHNHRLEYYCKGTQTKLVTPIFSVVTSTLSIAGTSRISFLFPCSSKEHSLLGWNRSVQGKQHHRIIHNMYFKFHRKMEENETHHGYILVIHSLPADKSEAIWSDNSHTHTHTQIQKIPRTHTYKHTHTPKIPVHSWLSCSREVCAFESKHLDSPHAYTFLPNIWPAMAQS